VNEELGMIWKKEVMTDFNLSQHFRGKASGNTEGGSVRLTGVMIRI
jgi:hypothetical protein